MFHLEAGSSFRLTRPSLFLLATGLLALILLAGCGDDVTPTAVPAAQAPTSAPTAISTAGDSPVQTATEETALAPTAVPPSPTPTEPLAALVNGRPIFLAEYEKELARYEQAQAELGLPPSDDDKDYRLVVLDALIETELIVQAAAANGLQVSPETVDLRLQELKETSGGADNFAAWLEANQWTEAEFRETLAGELLTEQMVALVTADVPTAVEQVRARYIQVDDAALAQSLLDQVRAGADFSTLAQQHSLDRVTGEDGGDLGFFARGSLLVPEIEAAAFALQPGEVSEVVTAPQPDGSGTAFYLVQMVERDPQRPLNADLRFELLQAALEVWLDDLWARAEVTRLVEVGA